VTVDPDQSQQNDLLKRSSWTNRQLAVFSPRMPNQWRV